MSGLCPAIRKKVVLRSPVVCVTCLSRCRNNVMNELRRGRYESIAGMSSQYDLATFGPVAIALQQFIGVEYETFCRSPNGGERIARHQDQHLKRATQKLEDLTIQPAESISFEFEAKVPGLAIETRQVKMHFDYRDYFGIEHQTGYCQLEPTERLIS
jgi:glucose-6-phosphate dehydrogenase-like protein